MRLYEEFQDSDRLGYRKNLGRYYSLIASFQGLAYPNFTALAHPPFHITPAFFSPATLPRAARRGRKCRGYGRGG